METYTKSELLYDYSWSVYADNDPRISGKPDSTPFDRREGEEVLYLIHCLSDHLAYGVECFGERIETLIHDHLPGEITTQAEALHWIKTHWRTTTPKGEGRSHPRGESRRARVCAFA